MDQEQERFLNELLNDFRIEASEHYLAIVEGLISLENSSDTTNQQTTIEKIFRETHSLKGASRAVNLMDIEKLCSSLENVFNSLKKGESILILPLLDALHKAADLLNLLLTDVNQKIKVRSNYNLIQILKNLDFTHRNSIQSKGKIPQLDLQEQKILHQVDEEIEMKADLFSPNNDLNTSAQNDKEVILSSKELIKEDQTVRISIGKLNSLLRQSEELASLKSTLEYFANELQNMNYENSSDFNSGKKHKEDLNRLIGEIFEFKKLTNRMVNDLIHDVKTTLLFPFSSLLNVFPKIVRDLSKEYSKEIEISIIGDKIEIDRRILEEMKDPLIHLIRNCIDHGIEEGKVRLLKGKPAKGRIEIAIVQNIDRKIELLVKDDGAGIDKEKIINSAIKSGILKSNEIEKLADHEIYSLIFNSGISASPYITDISGRGLGMAIVEEKVSKLGGSIELKTVKDSGTSFIISLPQTLATFRGLLIKSAEQQFIIPSTSIERAIRIKFADIKTVGSGQTICHKNETIGLALLSDVLKITTSKRKRGADEYLQIIILNISHKKIAFIVDEIFGEQEGIVKDLGSQLLHVNNIAGATILGNGKLVLILHPPELLNSAAQVKSSLESDFQIGELTDNAEQKRILVAEDSITIRTLLRNFIENAGFDVKTAVDGLEAFQFFQNENFDLVVSDIEMPRMNGFELTSKIRENKRHADLPIILVTALETADDKQRGMEVGANAYIIKGSFEKNNLIETIQRLI
jgi:two-component system chemotaxis sensor kinase CheA